MWNAIQDLVSRAWEAITELFPSFVQSLEPTLLAIREYLLSRYGEYGVIAATVLAVVIAFLIINSAIKLAFSVVKYVVVPALVLSLLASLTLPYNFFQVLPIAVGGCSIILLFKG